MKEETVSEKGADLIIGILLFVVGVVFLVLNFSLLPSLGLFIGLLFIIAGILFLMKHKRKPYKVQ